MPTQFGIFGGESRARSVKTRRRSPEERRQWDRNWKSKQPIEQLRKAANESVKRRRPQINDYKARVRAKLRSAGINARGKPYKKREASKNQKSLWRLNAQQAWQHWVKVLAPGNWLDRYYSGSTWKDHRLSEADRYRLRYRTDLRFQCQEVLRTQAKNVKRAALIAAASDGSLTTDALVGLFSATRQCSYCGRSLRSQDKTLDHIVALTDGGAHSIRNSAVCCRSCNTAKGTKSLIEWKPDLAATYPGQRIS